MISLSSWQSIALSSTHGSRLDQIPMAGLSRKQRKKLLNLSGVRHNHRTERIASRPVYSGDTVEIFMPLVWWLKRCSSQQWTPRISPMECMFEDDQYLVINKPPGCLSEPHQTSVSIFADPLLSPYKHRPYDHICHRLDRSTTGALIIAKNRKTKQHLDHQFKHHRVTKTYLALTTTPSTIPTTPHLISTPLSRTVNDFGQIIPSPSGRPTRTILHTIKNLNHHCSFIVASPITGRTHQLRVHLNSQGFTVLGDTVYEPHRWQDLNPHLMQTLISCDQPLSHMLHSYKIGFSSLSSQNITITAPLNPRFTTAIIQLSSDPESIFKMIDQIQP